MASWWSFVAKERLGAILLGPAHTSGLFLLYAVQQTAESPYAAIRPARICAGRAGLTRVPTSNVAAGNGRPYADLGGLDARRRDSPHKIRAMASVPYAWTPFGMIVFFLRWETVSSFRRHWRPRFWDVADKGRRGTAPLQRNPRAQAGVSVPSAYITAAGLLFPWLPPFWSLVRFVGRGSELH